MILDFDNTYQVLLKLGFLIFTFKKKINFSVFTVRTLVCNRILIISEIRSQCLEISKIYYQLKIACA